ncbi:MAG: hypothetical protein ACOH5I_19130 [Oligoflexus sp.]
MKLKYQIGLLGCLLLVTACADTKEEQIDKRPGQSALIDPGSDQDLGSGGQTPGPGSGGDDNTVVDENVLNFSGVAFQLAAGSDLLEQEYLDNLAFVSMVAEDTAILFGKDGTSWHYASEPDAAPQQILPLITAPEGRQLLSMDQEDFWIVGSDRVSKRKFDDELPPNQIALHNFDLSKLSGQGDQLRILGATHTSLVLYLGSHIAIFSVIDGVTAAYEFRSELPGGITGDLLAAGDTTDGGFWLATADKFAILKYVDLKWHWNVAQIPLNLESFSSLAARLDVEGQRLMGDSVAINGQVYSVSGAPIATPAP